MTENSLIMTNTINKGKLLKLLPSVPRYFQNPKSLLWKYFYLPGEICQHWQQETSKLSVFKLLEVINWAVFDQKFWEWLLCISDDVFYCSMLVKQLLWCSNFSFKVIPITTYTLPYFILYLPEMTNISGHIHRHHKNRLTVKTASLQQATLWSKTSTDINLCSN